MLRRMTALLLMMCLALFSSEALIADVHDGDATTAELQREGETHREIHRADIDPDGLTAKGQLEIAEDSGRRSHEGGSPETPVHAQHACHCVHGHSAGDVGEVNSVAPRAIHPSGRTAHAERVPPSVEFEPQLRPPIAV